MKKFIIFGFICITLLAGCSGRTESAQDFSSSGKMDSSDTSEYSETNDSDVIYETGREHYARVEQEKKDRLKITDLDELIAAMCRGCQVGYVGDTVEQDQVSYRLNSIYVTDKQGDWADLCVGPELDEEGNITDGSLYIVANITVTLLGSDVDFWWNNIEMSYFDDEERLWAQLDPTSVSELKDDLEPFIFREALPVNQEVTRDIIWTMSAEELKKTNHYFIAMSIHGVAYEDLQADEYSMFYLTDLEGLSETGKESAAAQ